MKQLALLISRTSVIAAALLCATSVARATTITVNSIADTSGNAGICTLRDAIIAANTNVASGGCPAGSPYPAVDTINIPQARSFCLFNPCTITLSSLLPTVVEDVSIAGTGTWVPTISGANTYRVLDLGGVTVNLSRLILADGNASGTLDSGGYGGGIRMSPLDTTLTASNVSFYGNHALYRGGALYMPRGTAVLTDTTFAGNTCVSFGGAINQDNGLLILSNSTLSGNAADNGGAIDIQGASETRLTNVTLSGNTAASNGGGISRIGTTYALSMNNVTITGNTADSNNDGGGDGGGFRRGGGTVTVNNSVIARNFDTPNNAGPGGIHADCSWNNGGAMTSFGYNLLGQDQGCAGLVNGVNGDKVGTVASPINPLLGPLTENGGATQTHALFQGSPAIDAGSPQVPGGGAFGACAATDQRNVARPVGALCDMGAYEAPLDDADRDGTVDTADNCVNVANGPAIRDAGGFSQLDADGDGYGNICDADLNNSGLTTAADFNLVRSVLNASSGSSALAGAADMNGSGLVTAADFNLLRARINTVPGPSGLHP